MKIKWLEEAVHDLHSLHEYIAQENPKAAAQIAKRLIEATKLLALQPNIGRTGRILHTRELIVPNTPFIIPYQMKNNQIQILRVIHCAMRWLTEL
ncbi:MAG TPA: type II toxin-antitoxin system RelE/ParE family toxin [Coxiellaceae bacterium]|nr:type II toxin-antitoxin system RelE/ParE family toxin [Coxiellaceae bacterium]